MSSVQKISNRRQGSQSKLHYTRVIKPKLMYQAYAIIYVYTQVILPIPTPNHNFLTTQTCQIHFGTCFKSRVKWFQTYLGVFNSNPTWSCGGLVEASNVSNVLLPSQSHDTRRLIYNVIRIQNLGFIPFFRYPNQKKDDLQRLWIFKDKAIDSFFELFEKWSHTLFQQDYSFRIT